MDLFEFTQVLRRRKKFLIAGVILIVGLVAFLSLEYDNGLRLRLQPRYESSIQMAVVPAGFDSLGNTLPNVGEMAGTTALFATLLASPEAASEITAESGVQLLDTLQVVTSGRDGFIDVRATAADPAGATTAALFSFQWLEQRIASPPSVVRPSQPDVDLTSIPVRDENTPFVGTVQLEASPSFVQTAEGLWVSLAMSEPIVTVSLADAGEGVSEYTALLEPGGELVVALEDVFGAELDAVSVAVPTLPDPLTSTYDLIVRLDRGVLLYPGGTEDDGASVRRPPRLLERHVAVSWQESSPGAAIVADAVATDGVGLLLLTEEPVATATGGRRAPIIIIAALVGGLYALIVIAVAIDAWIRASRRSQRDRLAIAELSDQDVGVPTRNKVGERR